MKEHIHLFTPVSEGLPETTGFYFAILDAKKDNLYTESTYYKVNEGWEFENVIAWLDLSKLTTKAKADELAREAYGKGLNNTPLEFKNGKSNEDNIDDFITQNINKL